MSVTLLPAIGDLDPDSLCYSIYTQLYLNFFNAQDPGTVAEGDTTSIRLRNTAYGFAEAIAGSVAGEGGDSGGGVLGAYLKLSGGNMSGMLRADYGFAAGIGNVRVMEVYEDEEIHGMSVTGRLCVDGDGFYLGGRRVLTYHPDTGVTEIESGTLSLGDTPLHTAGEILLGKTGTGVQLTPTSISVAGNAVYHGGNANNADTDWAMKDAAVAGSLSVAGEVTLDGVLTALRGVSLGYGGNTFLSIAGNDIGITADLDMRGAYAIRFGGKPVFSLSGADRLQVATPGGDMLLGAEPTPRVRLMAPLADGQGTRTLITPYGGAYFPDSLRVAHDFGKDLLSTYKEENGDQGIAIHKELRFGNKDAASMQGESGLIRFISMSVHSTDRGEKSVPVATWMGHAPSVSLFAPQNRDSDTFIIRTEGDFVLFDNRLEANASVGIAGGVTRIEEGCLFLTDKHRLQSVAGGVKHYGLALFTEGISSELFSSGLAGSGWAILRNVTTGNTVATFDEVVVRRKMRVYEMEVQRAAATNGSLWISDSCSGDSVEKL